MMCFMKNFLLLVMLGLFYASRLAAMEIPGPLVKGEWLANNNSFFITTPLSINTMMLSLEAATMTLIN